MLLVISKGKKLLEHSTKKELQKENQKEFRVEEREKVVSYMLNGKDKISCLIAR